MKNELDHLYQAKSIRFFEKQWGIETDEYVKNIIDEIGNKNCMTTEKPDISGPNFGIEHTEVYPFKKSKKGDAYKKLNAESIISDSVRVIKLGEFDMRFVDFQMFLKKLGIYKKSEFRENIISSIEEKSIKFLMSETFEKNGIWLEFPEYISFPNEGSSTSYFMQDEIYNSMINSPFDFFLYGNQKGYFIISKIKLIELKSFIKIEKNLTLDFSCNPETEFNPCIIQYKGEEQINTVVTCDMNQDLYFIAEDICSIHISHINLKIEGRTESDTQVYFYSDDIKLKVKDWQNVGSDFVIKYDHPEVSGEVRTNFIDKIGGDINAKFEKDDRFKLRTAQHDDNKWQKIFSGIKRFVIDKGSSIDIYIAPSPYVDLDKSHSHFRMEKVSVIENDSPN